MKEGKFNNQVVWFKEQKGAILNIGDAFYYYNGHRVNVAATAGSRDSFPAGVLSKFNDRAPPKTTPDFASAVERLWPPATEVA